MKRILARSVCGLGLCALASACSGSTTARLQAAAVQQGPPPVDHSAPPLPVSSVESQVHHLYRQVFSRDADPGGLGGYSTTYRNGGTFMQIRGFLARSQESGERLTQAYQEKRPTQTLTPPLLTALQDALSQGATLAEIHRVLATPATQVSRVSRFRLSANRTIYRAGMDAPIFVIQGAPAKGEIHWTFELNGALWGEAALPTGLKTDESGYFASAIPEILIDAGHRGRWHVRAAILHPDASATTAEIAFGETELIID